MLFAIATIVMVSELVMLIDFKAISELFIKLVTQRIKEVSLIKEEYSVN